MNIVIPDSFTVGPKSYSEAGLSNGKCFKTRPISVTVKTPEGSAKYLVCDGLATSKAKEIAAALGVEYKDSWFTDKIAQEILTKVLGSKFVKPKRGQGCDLFNVAIFDDVLLLHEYENDGCGWTDSIKKACYVYKKG